MIISILKVKSNFLAIRDFTKCFSGTTINQIVNNILNNCLVFSMYHFRLCKKCLHNFCLIRKWMPLEIVDKNVFKIITFLNNLLLTCRFSDHNLVFCLLYMIREIRVLCLNMVRESFN